MRRAVRTAMAAALLLMAAGCGADDEPIVEPTETSETPTASSTESAAPAALDWQPTGQNVDDRVIVGEKWTAVATETDLRFESVDGADTVELPDDTGGSVDAVLLEGDTAVVLYAFGGETVEGLGYRIDLATGEQTRIVTPAPANGGDAALIDDSLYYPALNEDQQACLATLAVSDGNGEEGWCPPERVGIAELEASEYGVAMMLFDYDSDISCRALHLLDQTLVPQPVDGPAECTGWDIAATRNGVIWSEVPRPKRQESAVFHAIADGTEQELGEGTTGSLISCGGDSFFVSDPATPTDSARLIRWDGTSVSVAYESTSKGNAFLARPECADGIVTITSFGEDGDEQVSASVS